MNALKFVTKVSMLILVFYIMPTICIAQKTIIDIDDSPNAVMQNVGLDEVVITGGFWKNRQAINRENSMNILWDRATNDEYGYSLKNFKVAAGLAEGKHQGVVWQDAWLYKWIETASYEFASTGDKTLLDKINEVTPIIAKAQQEDGYIATQVTAGRYEARWLRPDNHELYNMGHLLTAAAVNYRITGQTELLNVANKAADYCLKQFREHPETMWEFPLNPSIIMGGVELYRATGNQVGLELAKHVVDLRGSTYKGNEKNPNWGRPLWGTKEKYMGGRDLYQNYIPLRQEKEVVGHAVFFTYLYAGATDVYLETGDKSLMEALERLWGDLTEKKMYITGGVSPVHQGPVSRSFFEGERQVCRWEPIHEGVATPYDLPNATAYNETCGMVGNMMWNWRMLQATGDASYADIMELSWYNSILSGVQLNGSSWSYTNPLRWHGEEHELWSHDYHHRHVPGEKHICCPTNVMRNVSVYHGYLFSSSKNELWVHHYAQANAEIKKNGLKLNMETDYPWEGKIKITIEDAPKKELIAVKLRVPAWSVNPSLTINGEASADAIVSGKYTTVERKWKKGDVLELDLDMQTRLLVGNPLTEHIRSQVAVKRGPVVYCLESNDIPDGFDFESISIDADAEFTHEYRPDLLGGVAVIKTTAKALSTPQRTVVGQYSDITDQVTRPVEIELIPYYSWNNREEPKMSVWLPLIIK